MWYNTFSCLYRDRLVDMDKKRRYILGGIVIAIYVLLCADFIVSLCRAFMPGTEDGGIMASYVFVPFIIFAVLTIGQAVCFNILKTQTIFHVMFAMVKAILVLFFTWLMGYGTLRASFFSPDGATSFSSLSSPVYATILVIVYIVLSFLCAAFEIAYVMRVTMEQNMARKMARKQAEAAEAGSDVSTEGTQEDMPEGTTECTTDLPDGTATGTVSAETPAHMPETTTSSTPDTTSANTTAAATTADTPDGAPYEKKEEDTTGITESEDDLRWHGW